MRFVTVGVGAQRSPVYAPAGLLVAHRGTRVMIDGGPGAEPDGRLDAWLVTDAQAELRGALRRLARARGLEPEVARFERGGLRLLPRPVVHTNHPAYGYEIRADGARAVWAPEFFEFPRWAARADLMFAEAAAWSRPILFRGGVGGHMPVLQVARFAREAGVRRLVFAHVGRPTLAAIAAGLTPPFGELARDGQVFYLRARRHR